MLHTVLPGSEEVVRLAAVRVQHRLQEETDEITNHRAVGNAGGTSVQSHLQKFTIEMLATNSG
jgi:hypothetical protein